VRRGGALGASVIVGDVTKDPRYLTTFSSTRSEIVIPVLHSATGATLGIIDIESERPNAFKDDDRVFLEECASLLVPLYE
jgi:putative methionine-R-sulfoxide reductase with GAF domain